MTKLLLFGLATALLAAQAPEAPKKFARRKMTDQFVGAWKLVSYERRGPDGAVSYPMGESAVGRLTYDGMGRMSAQLMRVDRPKSTAENPREGQLEQKAAAYDGYTAYYGTYTVDEKNKVVFHRVEASLFPEWIGTDQRRQYEFSGAQLILRATMKAGGVQVENRLVWERAR